MEEAEPPPDPGENPWARMIDQHHVLLQQRIGDQTAWLFSIVSLDQHKLPPGFWVLEFTEEGHGFVWNADCAGDDLDARLVADYLKIAVHQRIVADADGRLEFGIQRAAAIEAVDQLRSRMTFRRLRLQVPPANQEVGIDTLIFSRARGGCRLFLHVRDSQGVRAQHIQWRS